MARQTESRQIEVLRYIHEQVTQKGYPPTVREIGEAVQLSSTSTVHGHLARLEKKGLSKRDPTKPRAIELTKQGLEKYWDSSNNYSSTWRRNSWRTHFSSRGCFRSSNPS